MYADWRSGRYFYGFGAAASSGCAAALSAGLAGLAGRVIPRLGPYSQATIDAIQMKFNAAMQAEPAKVTSIAAAFEQNANVELGPVAAPLISLFIMSMIGVSVTDPQFIVTTIVTELATILKPCKDGSGSMRATSPMVLPSTNVTEGDIGVDVKGRTWFYNAAGQLMVRQPCMKSVPDQVGIAANGAPVTLSWKTVQDRCETVELDPSIAKLVSQRLQKGDVIMKTPTSFVAVPASGDSNSTSTPFLLGGAALIALLLLKR